MTRLSITPVMALLLCIAPGAALQAQGAQPPATHAELTLLLGGSASARLDATASPRIFQGTGGDARLEYGLPFDHDRFSFNAAIGAAMSRSSARGASDDAAERTTGLELRGTLLRQWRRPSTGSAFGLGLAIAANTEHTQHSYADPTGRTSDFRMSTVTLEPAVAWTSPIRGGLARVQLTSPLIGLAQHPYSDVRDVSTLSSVRVESVDRLRGATASLSYTSPLRRGFALTYSYRFKHLDYADVQPFRSTSHGFAIGVTKRFTDAAGR